MPEPTASTSHQNLPSKLLIAIVVTSVSLVLLPTPTRGQDASVARLRAESQKLKQPLIKDFEVARTEFRRKRAGFERILRQGAATSADKRTLADGIQHSLYMLTDPDLRRPALQELREKFLRTMDKTAQLGPDNQQEKMRRETFNVVVEKVMPLLKGNFYVREQAIIILSSLNVVSTPNGKKPYAGSRAALLSVAKDSPFPEHRLLAMEGLSRLIRFTKLPANEEMEIAGVMAAELMKPNLPDGAYFLLAQFLGNVNHTFDVVGNRKPSPTIALMFSMCDSTRSWIARAAAARSLGNTGDASRSSGMRWPAISWKVAEFGLQAATEFERQRAAGNVRSANPVDARAIFDVFLSFLPDTTEGRNESRGLKLRSNDGITQGAYARLLPLVKGAIGTKGRINKADLDKLRDWLSKNTPADLRYHDQAPPITVKKSAPQMPAQEPPAGGNQQSSNSQTTSNMPPGQ